MLKHELILGSATGSGKTYTARQRIEEDMTRTDTQTWVIDGGAGLLGLANDVTRFATVPDGAHHLLYELLGHAYVRAERLAGLDMYGDFNPGDRRHRYDLLVLTIDDAHDVLSPESNRALVRILQMARNVGIKVRLTVPEFYLLPQGAIRYVMNGASRTKCDWMAEPVTA